MKNNTLKFFSLSILIIVFFISNIAFAKDYWVTKSGSDQNSCANNSDDACLTIQKAISLVGPGDTVNIGAGTYIEDSSKSPYTEKCVWFDPDFASLCMHTDGTPSNLITVQPAPGAEGQVIIDSESARLGLLTQNYDYLRIRGLKFINNYITAIGSWGQPKNRIADESKLSIGLIIEDNYIYNTNGAGGKNIAGIHMWGSKDWIVRNNYIDYVTKDGKLSQTHTSGIQAYGTINALIENNYIVNSNGGILWKDHFVADEKGTPIFESEIRNNIIASSVIGVEIIGGGGTIDEAGGNYIHHNIIFGYSHAAIAVSLSRAPAVSRGLRIEHNILDGSDRTNSIGVLNDAYIEHTMLGNIIIRNNDDIMLVKWKENRSYFPSLDSSNYNIYDKGSMQVVMDRYSNTEIAYKSLSEWQSATPSDSVMLKKENPDKNSIEVIPSSLFVDIAKRNYKHSTTSKALAFMPDKSNAGSYQKGSEIIGLLPSGYEKILPPNPPNNLSLSRE